MKLPEENVLLENNRLLLKREKICGDCIFFYEGCVEKTKQTPRCKKISDIYNEFYKEQLRK